jgi:hypothetical protein
MYALRALDDGGVEVWVVRLGMHLTVADLQHWPERDTHDCVLGRSSINVQAALEHAIAKIKERNDDDAS